MEYTKSPYFHIGRASELTGKDRVIYRIFEILPGFLSWGTLLGIVALSAFLPVYAALFIIIFDVYWVFKTMYLSAHLRQNWKRMKHNIAVDWEERLSNLKYDNIMHLVVLPFYDEGKETIEGSLQSLINTKGDKKKMAIVLATEERAGEEAFSIARELRDTYASHFGHFLITIHPKDISGEMAGKGSNISYATELAGRKFLINTTSRTRM